MLRRRCHPPAPGGNVRIMLTPNPKLLVLLCLALGGAMPAVAQVTVDLHALDSAPDSGAKPPDEAAPEAKPAPKRIVRHPTVAKPAVKPSPKPAEKPAVAKQTTPLAPSAEPAPPKPMAPAARTPPPPEPPAAVIGTLPAVPDIPPPVAADAPMAPVPPPVISTTAKTTIATLPPKAGDGVRLDFATGESDLTQGSFDAVKALVATAPKSDTTTFNVMAYAASVPDDPSTARRLSLTRALSVRSALMASGVASTHIYVRAMGGGGDDGPADRVDVLVMGANAAAPTPGGAPADAPAKTATP
jgi:outer membrane protein OmpA-like peptidoglycan-associated protein